MKKNTKVTGRISVYSMDFKEGLSYLAHRLLLLLAKVTGRKGAVFLITLLLLVSGRIGEKTYLAVTALILCNVAGLQMMGHYENGGMI